MNTKCCDCFLVSSGSFSSLLPVMSPVQTPLWSHWISPSLSSSGTSAMLSDKNNMNKVFEDVT